MTQNTTSGPTAPRPAEAPAPEVYQELRPDALRVDPRKHALGYSEQELWNGYANNDPRVVAELAESGYRQILMHSEPGLTGRETRRKLEKRGLVEPHTSGLGGKIGSAALTGALTASIR